MQRNTPAYAGKIRIPPTLVVDEWEHPRLRGENIYIETNTNKGEGTPPPTRGKFTVCD